MKTLKHIAVAALFGAAAFAATTGGASAYVACNRFGDCWHMDHRYHYDPDLKVQFHDDGWYFHRSWDHDRDHRSHDWHDGRGYWRNGLWVTF